MDDGGPTTGDAPAPTAPAEEGGRGRPLSASLVEAPDLAVRVDEAEPGPHGTRPEDRSVPDHLRFGVVNLDKPRGPTSHQVAAWVKQVLEVDKAGQGGTLDPKVSGVLPMALLDGTKVLPLLLESPKTYVCLMRLHDEVPHRVLSKALRQFTGEVRQTPPVKSAVKRRPRVREVHRLRVLEQAGRDVLLEVRCQAGTYVRKLVHDMGESMGVGAHMAELRRTAAGPMREEAAVSLHDLTDAYVLWRDEGDERWVRQAVRPAETVLSTLKTVVVRDTAVDALCHGADLAVPGVVRIAKDVAPGDRVACYTLKGEGVCFGEAQLSADEVLGRDHGLVVSPDRVLMEPGTYPKGW